MKDRATIIESAIADFSPADGDHPGELALIRFVNYRLVYEGHRQLTCCERRDVVESYAAHATVDTQ